MGMNTCREVAAPRPSMDSSSSSSGRHSTQPTHSCCLGISHHQRKSMTSLSSNGINPQTRRCSRTHQITPHPCNHHQKTHLDRCSSIRLPATPPPPPVHIHRVRTCESNRKHHPTNDPRHPRRGCHPRIRRPANQHTEQRNGVVLEET